MSLEEWELNVQVENPVDLLSLAHHGCVLRGIYQEQDLMDYFGMLNGATYLTLVRHLWVRAQIYDLKASQLEMDEKVLIDPSLEGKRKQIPCGRLLSEIFTQGKLLETLRRHKLASDKSLRTITGKIINGKTLQNMKIIKKFSPNEKDLKEYAVQTELMKDFPPISKERNPEVLDELIAAYAKESGGIFLDDDTPDVPDEAPLRVRGKRAKNDDGSEAAGVQTKKPKKDKSEASNLDSMPRSCWKSRRRRRKSIWLQGMQG